MLIVRLEPCENGALPNQTIYPALPEIPEGWAVVPPELEERAAELLPWVRPEVKDGKIVGVSDNAEARAAAEAEEPCEEPPTEVEQLRADLDYYAIMTGVEL